MILDCGCGTNRSYKFRPKYFFDFFNTVYLDIEFPHPLLKELHLNWVVGDAELLPFRSGSFDKVIASHLLEHLRDPERFISICNNLLKRNGRLIIIVPNFLDEGAYLNSNHIHIFNFIKLYRILRRNGFEVHFGSWVGTRIPRPIFLLLKILYLFICKEISVEGVKSER